MSYRDNEPTIRDMNPRAVSARSKPSERREAYGRATAHLTALRGIPEVLEHFGVRSEPLLEAAGITREQFNDPEATASFIVLDELLGTCARRTKCPHLGLLLSQYVNLRSLGIAGRIARNAGTVATALKDLTTYFALHDSGGSLSLANSGDATIFSYGIQVAGVRNTEQVYDLSVGVMRNVLGELCGPDWQPDRVFLPRPRPHDVRAYQKFFAAPIHFNAMQAGLAFPTSWLARPVEDSDTLIYKLLKHEAFADRIGNNPLLYIEVRRAIRTLLPSGQCSRGDVARFLELHERTLGRRLQSAGTTFQKLLDATRSEMAKQLLHDTTRPIGEIGALLGFKDPTVFTRAFRRWTDLTPREFRNRIDAVG